MRASRQNVLMALAAFAATGFTSAEASVKKLSREQLEKSFATPPSLPMSNPRHCPKGYGRPPKGWRVEQSRRRHKEIVKRQKHNRK